MNIKFKRQTYVISSGSLEVSMCMRACVCVCVYSRAWRRPWFVVTAVRLCVTQCWFLVFTIT